MDTSELVERIVAITGMSKKETKEMVIATSDAMKEALVKGYKIGLTGIGTFEIVDKKARAGINPKTLAKIMIPARKAIKFKASKKLKNLLN